MFLNLKKHLEVIENLAQQNSNNLYVVLTDLNQWKPGSDIDISFDGNIQEISAKILG